MKFTTLELYLNTKRQICPQTIDDGERVLRRFGCPGQFIMTIPRLFPRHFCSNCKSSQWSGTAVSLHYLTYEITFFSGFGVRRQFESLLTLKSNNKERKQRKKLWQLFSSYIKNGMELSSGNAGKVSLFNRNKCNSHRMINCFVFRLLKTLSLLFSKPFPLFFLFSKTPGIFLHICKSNVSSRFLLVLNQSGSHSQKRKPVLTRQTNGGDLIPGGSGGRATDW